MSKIRGWIKFCACALAVSTGIGVYTLTAKADTAFSGGLNATEYELYETLPMPEGKFGNVKAEVSVLRPDGIAVSGKEVELSLGGEYEVEYSAKVNGKTQRYKESFFVKTNLYSVTKKGSYVAYGKDENNTMGIHNTGREGLLVKLAKGDVFHYNDVIDVSKTTSIDNTAFKFFMYPRELGTDDAASMYMTFTDIYDPENKITVWYVLNCGSTYYERALSKAPGQAWAGIENVRGQHTPWVGGQLGSPIDFIGSSPEKQVGLYFPKGENALYMDSHCSFNYKINNDFDDTTYQVNPWDGFTTGEVYVDVWFEGYTGDTAGIFITNIAGQDLARGEIKDEDGPIISVEEEISYAGVAGYYYPVSAATAIDKYSHGNVPVSIRAFYNYARTAGTYDSYSNDYAYEADIQNGRFKTKYPGYYSVCYRAEDFFGNKTERVVTVFVDKTDTLIPVTDLTLGEAMTTIEVGNLVNIAEGYAYTGGTGEKTVEAEVKFGKKKIDVSGNSIDGYYFVPQEVGEYEITVFAYDELRVYDKKSYTLTVTAATAAAISQKIRLPAYFLTGYTYKLPQVAAVHGTTRELNYAQIEVTDGNGTRTVTDKGVSFKADTNGVATVTYYTATDAAQRYVVPVIDVRNEVNELKTEKYFVSDGNVTVNNSIKGITLTAEQDGKATFALGLIADKLEVMAMASEKNAFSMLSYTFTDTENAEISFSVSLERTQTGKANVYVNGKATGKTTETFNFLSDSLVSVKYSSASKGVVIGGASVSISKTLYGKEFQGFDSKKCYVSIGFEGVIGASEVRITKINNQNLNSDVVWDSVAPKIALNGEYTMLDYSLNEVMTAYTAICDDVLDPTTSVALSVTKDDVALKSTDGVILSNVSCERTYDVKFEEYGTYVFRYVAKDGNGKTTTTSVKITIGDDVLPSLRVDGNVPANVKKGKVSLPAAIAADNITENVTTWLSVKNPYGEMSTAKNNSFTADVTGTYVITYYAMDERGNTVSQTYLIKVA